MSMLGFNIVFRKFFLLLRKHLHENEGRHVFEETQRRKAVLMTAPQIIASKVDGEEPRNKHHGEDLIQIFVIVHFVKNPVGEFVLNLVDRKGTEHNNARGQQLV
mmetsp:Transcript_95310/g.183816  ORF Transcript_95310/g.183816 Transcript_95310/m.183816 type:complete len:104 (+) Transcript_95310:267-578(+)